VLRISNWVRHAAGSPVVTEGEVGTGFYVLASGEVKISKQDKLLNILRAGECFGEMAYLGRRAFQRTASVYTAVNDITLIEISADALCASQPKAAKHAFNAAFLELLVAPAGSRQYSPVAAACSTANISLF